MGKSLRRLLEEAPISPCLGETWLVLKMWHGAQGPQQTVLQIDAQGQGVEDVAEQLGLFHQLLFYTSILGFNTLGKTPNSRIYVLKDRNVFICNRSSHFYMERKLASGLDFQHLGALS